MPASSNVSREWPRAPVIYQIYPRSFRDSTGSGTGDLRGIAMHLDHVASLGVDAIWISPFYPSPFRDGGYDIADHVKVHPALGTMDDFDAVVAGARDLGLRVLIDQVFNHTSDAAPWFIRSVRGDPDFADHYVWRDPKPDGTPPNNWIGQFGTPAWTWNHERRQYYMHNFTKHQPSLNLRSEAVQKVLERIMRFWLDRGVDGFRLDAVTSFLFDPDFRDNPPADRATQEAASGETFMPYTYQDHVHDVLPGDGLPFMENLRRWAGDDAWLVGEVTSGNQSVELACGLTEPGRLDAAYTTDLVEGGATADAYAEVLERASDPQRLGWWLSSHDQPRHGSTVGDGSDRDLRFFALLLATAPGSVIVYQGEELGLPQPHLPLAAVTDPLDLLYWPDGPGREGARVPIPWAEGADRGFSIGTPWLPMDWPKGISVAVQDIAADSVLAFYRRALRFRAEARIGNRQLTRWSHDGDVIRLEYDEGAVTVLLNFGTETVSCPDGPPALSSQELDGNLPGRTGAVWTVA